MLIRWGDKVVADAPAFDPNNLSAAAQEKQFGYNCDFIAYMPLPFGAQRENGCLGQPRIYRLDLMFPGLGRDDGEPKATKAQVDVEIAAHGGVGRRDPRRRHVAGRRAAASTAASPANDADGDLRTRRRPCPAQDDGRSDRHAR